MKSNGIYLKIRTLAKLPCNLTVEGVSQSPGCRAAVPDNPQRASSFRVLLHKACVGIRDDLQYTKEKQINSTRRRHHGNFTRQSVGSSNPAESRSPETGMPGSGREPGLARSGRQVVTQADSFPPERSRGRGRPAGPEGLHRQRYPGDRSRYRESVLYRKTCGYELQ